MQGNFQIDNDQVRCCKELFSKPQQMESSKSFTQSSISKNKQRENYVFSQNFIDQTRPKRSKLCQLDKFEKINNYTNNIMKIIHKTLIVSWVTKKCISVVSREIFSPIPIHKKYNNDAGIILNKKGQSKSSPHHCLYFHYFIYFISPLTIA